MWMGIFLKTHENASLVNTDIFYTDKKDAFSKISGYMWTSLNSFIVYAKTLVLSNKLGQGKN